MAIPEGGWIEAAAPPLDDRLGDRHDVGVDIGVRLFESGRSYTNLIQALCHEPAESNNSLQPIADLGRAANGIDDLTRDPIPPNQVAARRLCSQGPIVGRHRDNLGGLDAKTFVDKLRRPHLNECRRNRQG